jgi:hypothetical protein
MDDERNTAGSSTGENPESTPSGPEREELLRRCETERDTMSPKETSDCAGSELADAYENEEDGGS